MSYLKPDTTTDEYETCLQRGHDASGLVLTSSPPWQVCKHCGVAYQFKTSIVEMGIGEREYHR